jgi:hypothetical protein
LSSLGQLSGGTNVAFAEIHTLEEPQRNGSYLQTAFEEMTVRAAFVNTTLPQDGVVPEYVVNRHADQADHMSWYQTNCSS